MKKSQIAGQPLLYVLMLIIFASILLIGYKFVKGIGETGDKSTIILFESEIQNDVNSMDYGNVKVKKYHVPANVDKICFSAPNNYNPLECSGCPRFDEYPILTNAIRDGVGENLFLIGGDFPESMKIDKIELGCCEFYCFDAINGEVTLKMEGLGDNALIKK